MIGDVYEPLELYQASLKETHSRNVTDFFENLVQESGVDEAINAETVSQIQDIEKLIAEVGGSNGWWKVLRIAILISASGCVYMGLTDHLSWLIGTAGLMVAVLVNLNPRIKAADERLRELIEQRAEKENLAWDQMEPLNQLYSWDIFAKLVHQTVPKIELDPYFTQGRLTDLRTLYGWDERYNDPRSVVFAYSGLINGNPFILAQTVNHWIGSKTYDGSRDISWAERVRNSQGRWTTIKRHQTLHASVEKPFPEYTDESTLIYGNQAAPDLSFSREPSSLSKLEDGIVSNWRKGRAIKNLEAKSRKLSEVKNFTIMANREFDALFAATDRDHEVQFRLLFTPLAQQEMVKILKDKVVGYGDDFSFQKARMINLVEPSHLTGFDISADPQKFRFYELARARTHFIEYHNELFKAFFFSFAPVLSIPLYQQHRPSEDRCAGILQEPSCYWEHEAIANYMGESSFEHSKCITRNILKTVNKHTSGGTQVIQVTAYGYRGRKRVDHVSVRGRDGRDHDVPVEWVEYIPVKRTSELLVCDPTSSETHGSSVEGSSLWRDKFAEYRILPQDALIRRSIVSALLTRS